MILEEGNGGRRPLFPLFLLVMILLEDVKLLIKLLPIGSIPDGAF